MPREKDPFRDYAEFLQNDKGKWKCNYCNIEYRGSVTRIKAHLAGVGGYGIIACKKVNRQVKSEARKALKGKGEAESSNGSEGNVEEGAHQLVTANNEDAPRERETSVPAMPYQSFDGACSSAFLPFPEINLPNQSLPAQGTIPQMDYPFWTQPPQHHAGDSYIQPQNMSDPSSSRDLALEASANMPGPVHAEEGEPNIEVPQDARTDYALMDSRSNTRGPVDENMPTRKRKLEEVSNREADMDKNIPSLPLVTTKLVGKQSKKAIKKICDYLMKNEINIIGIYGMGGVGKTAILMHVHNRVLENPAFSGSIFWVSVPQKFSLYKLQDEIANAIGLDSLSKVKDVKRRASILHRHLEKMESPILLLDGLWMHFEVKDLGIPIKKGGLRLVLTTRSLDVCHKMLCQKQIRIRPLFEEKDYWNLFLEKLGPGKELPSDEVVKIAESILDECRGLPLGIIEMATRMRGVEKVHEWKDLLQKLQESRMELDVLKELKLSYLNLGSPQVQRCFLHLVLCFGEDLHETTEEGLIESFIDEGLLGGIATRQKQHDQGNAILEKIRKSGLWDDSEESFYCNLHPLIRDMALQIPTSGAHMVKAHMRLEEFPEEELWTDHLEKVFLQGNRIKEIPGSISPNCPKLTSLSLNGNYSLETIHRSFFEHLKRLKVLDLSYTGITELPDAISDLESLEALLLRECEKLRRRPCVGKLGSLRKLDLRECPMLEEVPEGMEMLVKLTYLDLRNTGIETLPEGVLGKLLNLQYLGIKKVRAGEEIKLKKVEELYCSVPNVETFNACTRSLEQNSSRQYALALDLSGSYFSEDDYERGRKILIESCHSIEAWKDGGNGGDGGALLLPKNVQALEVRGCDGVTRLCEVGPLHNLEVLRIKKWENLGEVDSVNFPRLERLYITGCPKLKRFLHLTTPLPNLKEITIDSCEKLEEIIHGPLPSGVTCGLTYLEVNGCNNMKGVLLTLDMLLHLPSLQTVVVKDCESIEEIIGGGPVPIGATCGRLSYLFVNGCNNMKGVLLTQDMLLHLPSLQEISVENCEGIEEIIGGGPVPISATCGLTRLVVNGCNNMKRVLKTQDMLLDFPSLQKIIVKNCKGIEVIMGVVANTTRASFLKLTHLTLWNLPELKSICDSDGTVSCNSLRHINIWKCRKLKKIPMQLPLRGLLPSPPPSLRQIWIDQLTWESLEWDHPFASSSLQPLIKFHPAEQVKSPPNFTFLLSK